MKLCFISDIHLERPNIPECDILCVTGDLTFRGTKNELESVAAYFRKLLKKDIVKKIVFIAGNHDLTFETKREWAESFFKMDNVIYLQDNSIELDGLIIYGSPWQPEFCDWGFNLPRGEKLTEKWALIHDKVDILLTHGPPFGILDVVTKTWERVGCSDLMNRVDKVKPLIHAFGHIHCGYGVRQINDTLFINSSICDELYKPTNLPIIVELDNKKIIKYYQYDGVKNES